MRLVLLRHAMTCGNEQKRYIGKTDEGLSEKGRHSLLHFVVDGRYPAVDRVYGSPMKRCVQTAELVWPAQALIKVDAFRECDFGAFEGKNYRELCGNPDYQKWIDSNGKLPFPNGENPENFKKRCIEAFEKAIAENNANDMISFVVHGGTIMSVFEKYAVPHGDFYDFHVENASGFITEYNGYIKIKENI